MCLTINYLYLFPSLSLAIREKRMDISLPSSSIISKPCQKPKKAIQKSKSWKVAIEKNLFLQSESLSRLPAKGLRDGGGGCSILGTVRQLRPRMTMTSRYSADIAARLAPLSLILGWLRRGAGGPRYTKGRGRGGVQLRHVSATYILVRLILPGGIIARGRRERFHYTASRGIIFSDISSLAAPAGLKFRPSASPSAPLLPRGDPPQPLLETMEEIVDEARSRGGMAAAWFHSLSDFFLFASHFIRFDLDF